MLFELSGCAGVLGVDITTTLTGTLAVAIDSLPSKDTELAVVERQGTWFATYFASHNVLLLQARCLPRVMVFHPELIAMVDRLEY